jgi:hypothetical protein
MARLVIYAQAKMTPVRGFSSLAACPIESASLLPPKHRPKGTHPLGAMGFSKKEATL